MALPLLQLEPLFTLNRQLYIFERELEAEIFDGLRDLPQFGKRLWEPYFRRAFDIYNKLWKFQQEHRSTLEAEYGLQRHEVRALHMT